MRIYRLPEVVVEVCPIALNCDCSAADTNHMDELQQQLKVLIDEEMYVVDARTVADAILTRGRTREVFPAAAFRSDRREPEAPRGPRRPHHQTVESRFSISSSGRV
jgi:hypothetical protein